MSYTHYRTCNLCEAMCGLAITVENDNITSIKGDINDPFSRGHICPKAVALKDVYEDPNRLKHPVRRTADGWERISWEEAYDEVAQQLKAVQAKYGNNAVGVYLGNPNVHNVGSILFGKHLYRSLNTKNRFSATSTDQLPHHVASWAMFGNPDYLPVPDINRTHYWLILGGNPMVSNGSMMTAPDLAKRMKAISKRGKVVVIDPRRTETARKANEHYFIKPNTDVYLLLGLLHQVFNHNRVNLRHLEGMIEAKQLEELKTITKNYTAQKVAQYTGIEAAHIQKIAKDFCEAPNAVCYGRMGVSTVGYGSLCLWLIYVLNIVTGNFDHEGGAMFPSPAFDFRGNKKQRPIYGRWKSRVRGLPEFNTELPNVTMAEEILTQGEGQIKAMFLAAGNPVLSTANGKQLEKAFSQLEFMVAIDIYINESTRFANIILPPATGLETAHYDIAFHNLAIHNTAKYSQPLFDKDEDARYDWEIMKALIKRLDTPLPKDHPKYKAQQMLQHLTPEMILDNGLKKGAYQLSLEALKNKPHGIDLGPLKPQLNERIFTENNTINLVPDIYKNDLKRLQPTDNNGFDMLLIGRRDLRTNNSWMHNSQRLVKGKNRCTALINTADATAKNIQNGQQITVSSRVGAITIEAEITDDIMQGVISIPHGWGHHRKGIQLDIASQHAGISCNDLTDDRQVDELTGNAAVNGVPVRIGSHID